MADVLKFVTGKRVIEETLPGVSTIKYCIKDKIETAVKLRVEEYSEYHERVLREAWISPKGELRFEDKKWHSVWVGAGEEKSVYLVVDHARRAFALEVLSRTGYLEGGLADGHYFDELFLPKISGHRWHPEAIFGHTFSGLVKVREFIYGETLASPYYRDPSCKECGRPRANFLSNFINSLSRTWARWLVKPRYWSIQRRYRDTHEANVMIELLPLSNPEKKSHYLFPLPWLDPDGRLGWYYIRLTPIDVRASF